jgi:hypothetical protein
MTQDYLDDPKRFLSQISASEEHDDLFGNLYTQYDDKSESVAGLRRRRRRASNNTDDPIKTVSLIEQDGVLYWRDGIPAPELPSRRRAGDRRATAPPTSLVLAKQFPVLADNRVVAAVSAIDQRLNQAIDPSLRSRLRQLQLANDGFKLDEQHDIGGPFSGRTLLFIHGTFSNADTMLGEFAATDAGKRFLNSVMNGAIKYDQVVFFEHATLGISPIINALELGRAFAGSSGQIDVVAHSRGGLIARWWLEAFGSSLRPTDNAPARVIFAGSPLHGTSLASPANLQNVLSLISNIGSFAEATMGLVGAANPFLWVAGKLIEVITSVTGALAKTPLIDGLVVLLPGIAGQSAVGNNHELNRLREGPTAVAPIYYAVKSNFETQNPGWKFWQNFRGTRIADVAADFVFEGENDLVVDTKYMTDLGGPDFRLQIDPDICDFGTSDTVWHCNYFRQQKTIDYIAAKFSPR